MQQNVMTKRPPSAGAEWPAAIALLKRDHDEVARLFGRFERLGPDAKSEAEEIARRACAALTVHAAIEEELFYPETNLEAAFILFERAGTAPWAATRSRC